MTDENDFDTSVVDVMLPAGPIREIHVHIPIFDDDVDEAESQFFYAVLEIANATNLHLVTTEERNFSLCSIRDDDGKNIAIVS